MLVVASALRLGFVANFISEPVLVGFKSAIGVVIVVDQVPKLLGIHIHKEGFFRDLLAIVQQVPEASLVTRAVVGRHAAADLRHGAAASKGTGPTRCGGSGHRWFPRCSACTPLAWPRSQRCRVACPRSLWPQLDLVGQMWPAAAGIALMSFTETIAAARAFGVPREPRPVPNRSCWRWAWPTSPADSSVPCRQGAAPSQTAVNRAAGARTQVAELVTAAAAVATLLLLAPLIALMPQAALAAVVVVYVPRSDQAGGVLARSAACAESNFAGR